MSERSDAGAEGSKLAKLKPLESPKLKHRLNHHIRAQ